MLSAQTVSKARCPNNDDDLTTLRRCATASNFLRLGGRFCLCSTEPILPPIYEWRNLDMTHSKHKRVATLHKGRSRICFHADIGPPRKIVTGINFEPDEPLDRVSTLRIQPHFVTNGVPEGIRTPDPRFRKPVLYPAELPGRKLKLACRRRFGKPWKSKGPAAVAGPS